MSSTQLTALIPASDVATAGARNITVFNAGPNNQGTSNTMVLNVGSGAFPVVSSISPSSRVVGSEGFVIVVNGANFDSNSVVRFNGLPRPTTLVSSTQLTASILASDIAAVGQSAVAVSDPDSGTSNAVIFFVVAVPGLPDTGFGPDDENQGNLIVMLLLGLGALASVPLVRMIRHERNTR